ncbi:hypothetical protein MGWOODY_Mmi1032 [hydrothermal vent metagenome]|uniref:Uncharacterized protein n=1 Tax=hydrothermal vent metagenome TaxID=652676 RepID=A0A160VGU9_9ZZZZ
MQRVVIPSGFCTIRSPISQEGNLGLPMENWLNRIDFNE